MTGLAEVTNSTSESRIKLMYGDLNELKFFSIHLKMVSLLPSLTSCLETDKGSGISKKKILQ